MTTARLASDIRPVGVRLYFLPVKMRVPLKFGHEVVTEVTCARACLTVEDREGHRAEGWGETPLSVGWVWPGELPYADRHEALLQCTTRLAEAWANFDVWGHPLEVGHAFLRSRLPELIEAFRGQSPTFEALPHLAALVCCSAFDIALHDAFGVLHETDIYTTYNARFMSKDLSAYLEPAAGSMVRFEGIYPENYLAAAPPQQLSAWHLVGGLDPIRPAELTGDEPDDGVPVLLEEWIATDGLTCLKIKLRGNDAAWDYARMVDIGCIAIKGGAAWLSADFNCTVEDPCYVIEILDRLRDEHPRIYGMILYVEQPFPYDLEAHRIDVHAVAARKPLFMDESAHDWELVRLGRTLGWNGVALKTCKTQTGALLSLCWARAHGMALMVQDLTNPMLAQVAHVRLAAHAQTIMGVETNAMQFYPAASEAEARIHPGIYRRRHGQVDLGTLQGPGFGHCQEAVGRDLPAPAFAID